MEADEAELRLAVLADHLDGVDYYALLAVAHDADAATVRGAFHAFALQYHPDRHVDDPVRRERALAVFKRGNEAYRVLLSPGLRARYDQALKQGLLRLPHEEMKLPANATSDGSEEVPASVRTFYLKALEAFERNDLSNAKMFLLLASRERCPPIERLEARIRAAEQAPRKR